MKRFEFRLDSVLRLRQLELEAEEAKLQQFLGEQHRLSAALQSMATERHQAKAFVYNLPDFGTAELRNMSAFLLGLDVKTNTTRKRLEEAVQAVKAQRQRVVHAERNEKLLEKLRTRKLDEWKREADRELEDIAQDSWLSANRKRKEASLSPPPTAQHPAPAKPTGHPHK